MWRAFRAVYWRYRAVHCRKSRINWKTGIDRCVEARAVFRHSFLQKKFIENQEKSLTNELFYLNV